MMVTYNHHQTLHIYTGLNDLWLQIKVAKVSAEEDWELHCLSNKFLLYQF